MDLVSSVRDCESSLSLFLSFSVRAAPEVSVRERLWGHEPSNMQNTFTVNSTHCRLHRWTWPQSRHTHIHINICMGNHSSSQWRSITAHHSHKPTPGGACALYGTQSAAFYWLDTNMVNFRLQEWTLHSGSEHIVIHARGSENKPKWPF